LRPTRLPIPPLGQVVKRTIKMSGKSNELFLSDKKKTRLEKNMDFF